MSTESTNPVADCERSDTRAVLKQAFERPPLDPEVARRGDERADRISELVRQITGSLTTNRFNCSSPTTKHEIASQASNVLT
jgi:hypothetical protein